MKTLVCIKPGTFEYAAGKKPELKKDQAIIRISRMGTQKICTCKDTSKTSTIQ